MTRSAGFLIEATGADITVDELTVLLNDASSSRIGRGVPLMPGARRLLAELAAHGVPAGPGLRLAPRASSTAMLVSHRRPTTSRSPSPATS